MIIKLPKPKITCPKCGSDNLNFFNDGWHKLDIDEILIDSDCNNCETKFKIKLIFEEDTLFCNCEVCKKINIDKDNKK